MEHPVRRRILMVLMVLQSAGLVTMVSTLVLSFVDTQNSAELLRRGGILLMGLGILWILARSRWLELALARVVDRALRRFTHLTVTDFFSLLNLEERYSIAHMTVRDDSWVAGRTLAELELPEEGVLVLGIRRADDSYVGAPRGRYTIHEGERLILYGLEERLTEIKDRLRDPAGDRAREEAERLHEEDMAQQDRDDLEHERQNRSGGQNS